MRESFKERKGYKRRERERDPTQEIKEIERNRWKDRTEGGRVSRKDRMNLTEIRRESHL